MDRWFITAFQETASFAAYHIVLTTDAPCHLWLRWSFNPPQRHPISRVFRGLAVMGDVYYCFTAYHDIEQDEAGDTLTHTFTVSPWPSCQTRWFYFHGEVTAIPSPSTSPIFGRHLSLTHHSFKTTITTPGNCANRHGGSWRAWPTLPVIILTVGRWQTPAQKEGGGMRFEGVTIPRGAESTTARLWLTCHTSNANPAVKSRLGAELSPNAATLANITYPQFLTRRDTRVGIRNWDNIEPWVEDGVYISPDISSGLTTVFNQAAWESGNAVLIFWDDFDYRTPWNAAYNRWAHGYFYQPTKAPRLYIEYDHWQIEEIT